MKKKNAQDSTMRNVKAMKARFASFKKESIAETRDLKRRVRLIEKAVETLLKKAGAGKK